MMIRAIKVITIYTHPWFELEGDYKQELVCWFDTPEVFILWLFDVLNTCYNIGYVSGPVQSHCQPDRPLEEMLFVAVRSASSVLYLTKRDNVC